MRASLFHNRREAGRELAKRLAEFAGRQDVLVLALPRGGVPVAYEVAEALKAPLDVFVVRKLGVPGYEELAMGAVASGGVRVLNRQTVEQLQISDRIIDQVTSKEQKELARRESLYRNGRPPPEVHGRTAILVDDGLATGATMKAAIEALRQQQPASIIVAVPVAAAETCEALRDLADEVICAFTPEPLYAVGAWYVDFSQTSDEEVRSLLAQARRGAKEHSQAPPPKRDALSRALSACHLLTGSPDDYNRLLDRVGSARFVLLGEASHGTHEFYR